MFSDFFCKNDVKKVLQVFDCKVKNQMLVLIAVAAKKNLEIRWRNCSDFHYLVNLQRND